MSDRIHAADPGTETTRIAVRGLTKIFGEAHALPGALALAERGTSREEILAQTGCILGLRDVSFDVREGEVLVVMGLSGSGKSTTLRCINRLVEPSAGHVTVDGVEVNGLGEAELLAFRRRKFGMVFQQFALFPHRSILANVGYGLEVQGVGREERESRARAAIEQVGLAGYENARPAQLSGGMQQRAGLARALAVDADILLMDEAFSALDPLIRRDMQRQLVALQDRLHKTIVFVSHDLDEAIALGGRIVLMKDGAIVQGGTALDLLTAPADDYVARFVAHIDVLGVLTVASCMHPAAAIPAGATAGEALARLGVADEGFTVDSHGRPSGRVARERLAAAESGAPAGPLADPPGMVAAADTTLRTALPAVGGQGVTAVVDGDGRLAGALTQSAIIAALAARVRPDS
ncbi:quaternary amine ABC transporter ATP-binding protein [Faunimonas sp. B44]|uniref:quaternary amine ABC transporter ATP-binding protein n=1 Tax=Faunimonas sp. B44 TaxID=3461493 RepID=UPI004044C07F